MKRIQLILLSAVIIFLTTTLCNSNISAQQPDSRDVANGWPIYKNGYIDQPYVVVLEDGTWLCVFTTGSQDEGQAGQHIASVKSSDQGKTWSDTVRIESPDGPAASWAMPYLTPYGRIYVFYSFNGGRINSLKGKPVRNDMLGWYCFRYSDDSGSAWSKRYRLPMRITAADRGNDWNGSVQIFWGIGKPVRTTAGMMFGFTKIGKYMLDNGEGWFYRSENIDSERNADNLSWELLPEGDHGVRNPLFGSVQEEYNLVQLNNGYLYTVYRTARGFPAYSISKDGGKNWIMPRKMKYANGNVMKNPRACPKIWKTKNGKYLFWFHNHSGKTFAKRNPAWIAGGIEKNGNILWSEPEIIIYGADTTYTSGRYSYPDLIETDGNFWITATNKVEGKVHEIDRNILKGLWNQFSTPERATEIPALEFTGDILDKSSLSFDGFGHKMPAKGITLEFALKQSYARILAVLFDGRDRTGNGLFIDIDENLRLRCTTPKNGERFDWTGPVLDESKENYISMIFDNGPKIFYCVVNGVLYDGGNYSEQGWQRYNPAIWPVPFGKMARIPSSAFYMIRIYKRALRVSEAVSDYRLRTPD